MKLNWIDKKGNNYNNKSEGFNMTPEATAYYNLSI